VEICSPNGTPDDTVEVVDLVSSEEREHQRDDHGYNRTLTSGDDLTHVDGDFDV
jgi:hypothetical protein